MKTSVKILLPIYLVFLACVLMFTACNDDTKQLPLPTSTACQHTIVTDEAIEPTCTKNGKTEGSHCETCNQVLTAQKNVPAKRHDWQENKQCKNCGDLKPSEGLKYGRSGENYIVVGIGTCKDKDIVIPKTVYQDIPIVSIAANAFENCTFIETVTINADLTKIGDSAFDFCINLKKINLPDTIKTIGKGAFNSCSSLYDINLPNTVETIGKDTFNGCYSLYDITLPETLTTIGEKAFAHTGLKSITIPKSVTSIGEYAFATNSIKKVYFNGTVATVGTLAFGNTIYLEEVHISDLAAWCEMQFADVFSNPLYMCKKLYLNGKELSGDIVLPEGTKSIAKYAFYQCDKITSITIPASVTSIGEYAFLDCNGLESVYISDLDAWLKMKIENLQANPFYFAKKTYFNGKELPKDFVIPNGITTIEDYTLSGCEFTTVTIPDGITHIGKHAFSDCSQLTSIEIPNSVKTIDDYAFKNCVKLTSITIPDGIQSINKELFYGCTRLKNITIPENILYIEESAFAKCSSIRSIIIPKTVKRLSSSVFSNCSSLSNIWCEAKSLPSLWHTTYKAGCSAKIHWGVDWEYVDGVPTLK